VTTVAALMTKLMIVVASVRPGRVGLPIAKWVEEVTQSNSDFDIDFADLAEINLPFMDEPAHPMAREYTKPHTIAWSERVDAADAFIFVTPEYNHSFSPALKNAMDFLKHEWDHKPVGFVSYGGSSSGTRGVAALDSVLGALGMRKVSPTIDISGPWNHLSNGTFAADERQVETLIAQLAQLKSNSARFATVR
jgi:NAD(P)H-dependent FMN reductase